MKRIYNIILIGTPVLVITLGMLFWLFIRGIGEIDIPSTRNDYIVDFEKLQEKIYIRAKSWGVAGNHEEIILATSPIENENREYSKDRGYVFYSSELFYKKKGIDTLLVYVDYRSKEPKNLPSQIKIVQIELKDTKEIKDYEENYKKYGLSKVSVYKE